MNCNLFVLCRITYQLYFPLLRQLQCAHSNGKYSAQTAQTVEVFSSEAFSLSKGWGVPYTELQRRLVDPLLRSRVRFPFHFSSKKATLFFPLNDDLFVVTVVHGTYAVWFRPRSACSHMTCSEVPVADLTSRYDVTYILPLLLKVNCSLVSDICETFSWCKAFPRQSMLHAAQGVEN